jgi:hypothetical protein
MIEHLNAGGALDAGNWWAAPAAPKEDMNIIRTRVKVTEALASF